MANRFLDSICAALENNEDTEAIMNEVPTAQDIEAQLPRDPASPGDSSEDPNGKADKSEVTELPGEAKASTEEAPGPGDPTATPVPASSQTGSEGASESFSEDNMSAFILSALESDDGMDGATELFGQPSRKAKKAINGMNGKDIATKGVVAYCRNKGVEIDKAHTMEWVKDDGIDSLGAAEILHTPVGPVVYFNAPYSEHAGLGHGDVEWASSGEVKFFITKKNGKRAHLLTTIAPEKLRKYAGYDTDFERNRSKYEPKSEGEGASESMDVGVDTLTDFTQERDLHKNRNLIPLQQEKDAFDASGNTGDPAENKQTPVTPSGEPKQATLDKAVNDSYSADGHTDEPGVNGTPVSKSGESHPLPKNEFENAADDKDGNPDSPGVNGNPAPSIEAFITACEQLVTEDQPGTVNIPDSMSLESYVYELGMGELASRAVEASLTAAEKRALKDSDFGLPEERKWPLNDEDHVRSAIQHFHWCPKDKQRELAKNILKAMRKFKLADIDVSEGNPFIAYYPNAHIVPRKKPERKKAQQ